MLPLITVGRALSDLVKGFYTTNNGPRLIQAKKKRRCNITSFHANQSLSSVHSRDIPSATIPMSFPLLSSISVPYSSLESPPATVCSFLSFWYSATRVTSIPIIYCICNQKPYCTWHCNNATQKMITHNNLLKTWTGKTALGLGH